MEAVYKGQPLTDHVDNFFTALKARRDPVSDVASHHRALTTCHLAGIAARLGRPVKWDAEAEEVVSDPQAQALLDRPKRSGYDIEM